MTRQYQREHIYIRAIEFGLRYPSGFSYNDILNDKTLGLTDIEKVIIKKQLLNAYRNADFASQGRGGESESLFQNLLNAPMIRAYDDDTIQYILSLDSHFKYIDYQELKYARKAASEARFLAIAAIIVSAVIPLCIASYLNQTVKIEDAQFKVLESKTTPNTSLPDPQISTL